MPPTTPLAVACPECLSKQCACPSNTPDSLNEVLNDVHEFLARFVVFPTDHAHTAATLWAAHTHVMDAWEVTPRLAALSPEPGSGKTRLLEVLSTLVPAPMHAVNATPAALFRSVNDMAELPTILFDEIDTVFGPKAKDNEEVRGFLNAGHRRNAVAYRCVGMGTTQTVQSFPSYCAVAVAGLNDLPDTIASRAVVIRMRKRAPGEHVEPWRHRESEPEGHALKDRLATHTQAHAHRFQSNYPVMPPGLVDRPADVWESLIAVADAAGEEWPALARNAALEMTNTTGVGEPSLGVLLLTHLRDVWNDLGDPANVATTTLLERLAEMDEAPWADLRGKPLDARGLARILKRYEVRSMPIRNGDSVAKGFRREDLWDAWQRYCPTTETKQGNPNPAENVTLVTDVTDFSETGNPENVTLVTDSGILVTDSEPPIPPMVTLVTDVTDFSGTRKKSETVTLVTNFSETGEPTCRRCGERLDDVLGLGVHPGCEGDR